MLALEAGGMDRLKPMDAQFIDAEDQDQHASFAIAAIAIFESPAPSYEEFLLAIEGRLPLVPIYRRKLRTVPFRLGPPVWVDDPDFDLRYHVRHTGLPSPGNDEQLGRLIGRVMGQRLDRDYPLWEYWLVTGLADDQWALISKVHHAMVDGVSGTDLYRVVFDLTPEPAPPAPDDRRQVPVLPSGAELAARSALDMMLLPVRTARAVGTAVAQPGQTVRQAARTAAAVARMAVSARPTKVSSLSGRISRQRRYAWARASLPEIKAIKNALGGTVNDVVLAVISSGFRTLLLSRGEEPGPRTLPSLIPVSLRAPGEESLYDNRVSVLIANLPVHLDDPAERLRVVRDEMAQLKQAQETLAAEALVGLGRLTPYPLASLVVRLAYRLPHHEIVTVATNVPGPREPLYGLGRRLVEIIPYVPIATTLRTGISIFSYCDRVTFGVTADYDSVPDIDVLARGIQDGVAELLEAAVGEGSARQRSARPHPARQRPAGKRAATRPAASKRAATQADGSLAGQGRGPHAALGVSTRRAEYSPVRSGRLLSVRRCHAWNLSRSTMPPVHWMHRGRPDAGPSPSTGGAARRRLVSASVTRTTRRWSWSARSRGPASMRARSAATPREKSRTRRRTRSSTSRCTRSAFLVRGPTAWSARWCSSPVSRRTATASGRERSGVPRPPR
jgi:WS/DGAT/MGAT family acyltransferase